MYTAGCDDDTCVGCEVLAEEVKQEGVTDVVDGKSLFYPVGGVLVSEELQTSIQDKGGDKRVLSRFPIFCKDANITEAGEVEG